MNRGVHNLEVSLKLFEEAIQKLAFFRHSILNRACSPLIFLLLLSFIDKMCLSLNLSKSTHGDKFTKGFRKSCLCCF